MCVPVFVCMCTPVAHPGRAPEGSHRHTSPQQQANGSRVNVLYSTPACYLWELNKAKLNWYFGGLGSLGGLACPVRHGPAPSVSAAAGQ